MSELKESADSERFAVRPNYRQPQTWLVGLRPDCSCCVCLPCSLACRCPFAASRDLRLQRLLFLAFVFVCDFYLEFLVIPIRQWQTFSAVLVNLCTFQPNCVVVCMRLFCLLSLCLVSRTKYTTPTERLPQIKHLTSLRLYIAF